ncbi:PREDICTED: DNA ligase 1-like, partial [Wasmannia auropunctata]|uniref:DNA ligase 1-like n=1 Tax=Wasmannia auropunctata TaxID=64793 RepID=UPI0005ED9426
MENKNNSDKDLPKRTTDQKNATEAERRFLAESKILIIEATSKEEGEDKEEEEEERSSIKGTNFFRKEAMKENNGMLKGTTASESFSRRIDNTERSVQERKRDTVTKITIAEQFNETRSLPGEFSSDGSKREINNPRKMGDMATADRHRCQRPLRDIIGKREQRREELEKVEGDLRQRLDMLECSMPAVMVWNTWRMSQGAPACRIKHILEKQFKDTGELSCRSTPSCHYDCRVREVEAERKLALKKVEEARTLWSEKLATLEERERKLGEARKIQEEQRNAIERLNEESRVLRETREKKPMEMEELCQCGDTQCKQRHLSRVSSVTSVESGDIKCLEKLQRLAEEEVITKREIAELERREEAYMTTLQKADELWSKMEGDVVSTTNGLQEQLDMKIAANQQLANRVCELEDTLEKCRTRLATCTAELEKFLSIEKVEATIGRDDDVAKVVDKKVAVRAKVVHRPIGRVDDIATVKDDEVLAKVEVADGEALATVAVTDADVETAFVGDDKFVSVRPDLADLAVDRPVDLVQIEDAESVVRPEDLDHEQLKFKEVQKYLTKLGSLEELYKDDGEPCAPDFVCNDVVTSPTGMTDEELIALGVKQPAPTKERDKTVSDEEERKRQFQKELDTADAVIDKKEKREDEIPGVEIEKRVVEKVEKRVAPEIMVDVSVRETVTPRTIKEEAADDRLVTMPKTRAPEIEADRDVVIQRDTVLSWIDAIDTIRTTAAKHPECREVEKDADILAEQVGTYVGIKPKEVKEKNATIITEAKKMEPETKIEFAPFPDSEETRAEIKAPTEAIAESELLPTLTKEEVPIGMEPPTAVSMDDSFQPPTIHDKKDLKDDTIPLAVLEPHKPDIEKIKTEETRVDEIVRNAKEIEVPKNKNAEKDVAVEDLINNKLTVILEENDKTVNSIDKKEILVVPKIEMKEQEIIFNHIERDEKKEKDMLTETIVEDEKVDKVLPVTEIEEREFVEQIVGKSKEISQQDETKMADIKEMIPHMEIIRTNEIAEVPAVAEMEEVEQDAEKTTLAVDMEEIKQIIPETILPTVDITEVEKFEPEKFPIVDIEKAPNAVEEKIKIEEPTPILDVKEEPLLLDAVMEKKVEIEKPVLIKEEIEVAELLPVAKMAEREEIVIAELPPIEDVEKKEKIEAIELPPILDTVREEKIEAVESIPLTDAVTEEKIEIIQPIPPLTIKREMEKEE